LFHHLHRPTRRPLGGFAGQAAPALRSPASRAEPSREQPPPAAGRSRRSPRATSGKTLINDTVPSRHLPTLRLGLLTAPGAAEELARQLADDLPSELAERVSAEVAWEIPVVTDELATRGRLETAVIDTARERMLREGWDLAVVLTDLPLHIGRRPVVADASATHGVALISLPAFGAVQMRRRARDAVVRLVDGLVGESLELGERQGVRRRQRVRRRLAELARAERSVRTDDDGDVRLVAAVVRGNARLLAGMLRANQPWRLVVRLSRALTAAIAAVVFALVTSDIWRLSDALSPLKLGALTVISLATIVVFLIVSHGLWSRSSDAADREQAILFNVATTLTLIIGVASLYGALFVLGLAGAALALDQHVLSQSIGHHAAVGSYVKVAWMASSLATVAGALGAGLESDDAVREAAYGYRPERETEHERPAPGTRGTPLR
jgi:hypothetical protein